MEAPANPASSREKYDMNCVMELANPLISEPYVEIINLGTIKPEIKVHKLNNTPEKVPQKTFLLRELFIYRLC